METLRIRIFLALIPAQYLHAVVQNGTAMTTESVLTRWTLSRGEAVPISRGNPVTVRFFVMASK